MSFEANRVSLDLRDNFSQIERLMLWVGEGSVLALRFFKKWCLALPFTKYV